MSEEAKEFIRKMLQYGYELGISANPIETSMIINDAEILYRQHIEKIKPSND